MLVLGVALVDRVVRRPTRNLGCVRRRRHLRAVVALRQRLERRLALPAADGLRRRGPGVRRSDPRRRSAATGRNGSPARFMRRPPPRGMIAVTRALPRGAHGAAVHRGALLSGTFKAVPNSEGAGNIVYALRVKNTLDAHLLRHRHPRRARSSIGATENSRRTRVPPSLERSPLCSSRSPPARPTKATARFSPDVPGTGEQTIGQCEPKSYWLRVTPNGGGTFRAPVQPPTPVCEHGGMSWSVFTIPAPTRGADGA